jgi:DNA repair protein RecN (Recombination protein N)
MLRFLSIKRLAVIDSAEVEFGPGLNVLTGETGAGKSILIEAVGLLLGGRASGDLVRTGEETATIEAIFETAGHETLVRRELTSQGRSRAFVNGALTTAAALKDLAGELIELHGQHEHQTLLDPATHLPALDAYAHLGPLLAATSASFERLASSHAELDRVRRAAADRTARQELVEFQLAELDRASLKLPAPGQSGEDVELASLRQVLMSAERIERLCAEAYGTLYESDGAVLAGLGGVWRRVADLAALDTQFQQHLDARDTIKAQLEDLAMLLRRYADGIEASPKRLQEVEDRLALLERLKRKHGPTLADVVAKRDALRRELEDLAHADERIGQLDREWQASQAAYVQSAKALSAVRRADAPKFAKALERLLGELAMPDTRFEVRFTQERLTESQWGPAGFDAAEFFLSPNPGEDLRPLARIVSGGELSRVMLALKTLLSSARAGFSEDGARAPSGGAPGLIFDEVDAGIGGRVADVVGRKLHALASVSQVLCITHLPQIAAYADAHFQIEKAVEQGRTRTAVRELDMNGRVEELSRMLGGALVSDGVRASAREMLSHRRMGEHNTKGESERAKAKPANRPRRTAG